MSDLPVILRFVRQPTICSRAFKLMNPGTLLEESWRRRHRPREAVANRLSVLLRQRTDEYAGREMKLSHKGMQVGETDRRMFIDHLESMLNAFQVPLSERSEVLAFIDSAEGDIVEA